LALLYKQPVTNTQGPSLLKRVPSASILLLRSSSCAEDIDEDMELFWIPQEDAEEEASVPMAMLVG
jgi:hypothetical protein